MSLISTFCCPLVLQTRKKPQTGVSSSLRVQRQKSHSKQGIGHFPFLPSAFNCSVPRSVETASSNTSSRLSNIQSQKSMWKREGNILILKVGQDSLEKSRMPQYTLWILIRIKSNRLKLQHWYHKWDSSALSSVILFTVMPQIIYLFTEIC